MILFTREVDLARLEEESSALVCAEEEAAA